MVATQTKLGLAATTVLATVAILILIFWLLIVKRLTHFQVVTARRMQELERLLGMRLNIWIDILDHWENRQNMPSWQALTKQEQDEFRTGIYPRLGRAPGLLHYLCNLCRRDYPDIWLVCVRLANMVSRIIELRVSRSLSVLLMLSLFMERVQGGFPSLPGVSGGVPQKEIISPSPWRERGLGGEGETMIGLESKLGRRERGGGGAKPSRVACPCGEQ